MIKTSNSSSRKFKKELVISFPFLILAGVSCLILAGDIQTDAGTKDIPLAIMLTYALSGLFFFYGVVRVFRLVR